MNAVMFSTSFAASKLSLPTTAWTLPPASLRNSTLPALYSLMTLADVGRHRAGTRRRHQAAGAQDLAQRTDNAHHVRSGNADVEIGPAALDLLGQLRPADFVGPGGLGLVDLVALGEDDHPQRLADAVGSTIEPRTNWSACLGSIPNRMTISTVWSNFVVLKVFSR